jgi:membrane protein implicated in regulation of membrane protease activity
MIYGVDAWIFWLILMIVCLVLEAISTNMTTIWFAAGSLAALLLDMAGVTVWIQVIVMIVVSLALLLLFLKMIKPRFVKGGQGIVATNADRMIGEDAQVIESIDPVSGVGLVRALGQVWSALSLDGQPIEQGAIATIREIRGVKAVVTRKIDGNAQPESSGEGSTKEENQ